MTGQHENVQVRPWAGVKQEERGEGDLGTVLRGEEVSVDKVGP